MFNIKNIFKKKNKKIPAKDVYIRSEFIHMSDYTTTLVSSVDEFQLRNKTLSEIRDFIYHHNMVNDGIVYMGYSNIIILINFTEEYFSDVTEFASSNILTTKYLHSSLYKEDENQNPIVIPKYYLLMSGSINQYINLYEYIDNLSNAVLKCVTKELYENVPRCYFGNLIGDNILDYNQFAFNYHDVIEEHSIVQTEEDTKHTEIVSYDPADIILEKLPNCFTGSDLLTMITFNIFIDNRLIRLNGLEIIFQLKDTENKDVELNNNIVRIFDENELFKGVIKNPTISNLSEFTKPIYKRTVFDSDLVGGVSDEEIDDIFKQQYDKFTGIVSNDVDIQYEEVDEVIEDKIIDDEGEQE